MGRTLLAHASPQKQREAIDACAEDPTAKQAVTAQAKLIEELERIRVKGFAIADQLRVEGQRCVAAPLRSSSNEVIAAVEVAAAKSAFSRAQTIERLAPLVVASAAEISAHLGYSSSE
jgi:DNA-binding IclR family transcriptional regulator